jgi:hypothetical protein
VILGAQFHITAYPWPATSCSTRSRRNFHHSPPTSTMIRAQTLHVTFWLVCLSYMVRLVSAQDVTFPDVPSTPFIDTPSAGNFTWPSGSTGIFDQGTPMRIAWESPYTQINLYLIWNQTVNEGIGAERQKQIGSKDISPALASKRTNDNDQLGSPVNRYNGLLIATSMDPIPAPEPLKWSLLC